MHVLLIEDDPGFRAMLALALKRRGCTIAETARPDQALTLAATESPSGVVLDLRLGTAHGESLIPHLRRLLPQARLIVLTGYGSIPGALQAVRLGADDYLLKPANGDQVHAALTGRRLASLDAPVSPRPSLARLEWEHIQQVLHDCHGNITKAAEALGIDRRTLQRKLSKIPPQT